MGYQSRHKGGRLHRDGLAEEGVNSRNNHQRELARIGRCDVRDEGIRMRRRTSSPKMVRMQSRSGTFLYREGLQSTCGRRDSCAEMETDHPPRDASIEIGQGSRERDQGYSRGDGRRGPGEVDRGSDQQEATGFSWRPITQGIPLGEVSRPEAQQWSSRLRWRRRGGRWEIGQGENQEGQKGQGEIEREGETFDGAQGRTETRIGDSGSRNDQGRQDLENGYEGVAQGSFWREGFEQRHRRGGRFGIRRRSAPDRLGGDQGRYPDTCRDDRVSSGKDIHRARREECEGVRWEERLSPHNAILHSQLRREVPQRSRPSTFFGGDDNNRSLIGPSDHVSERDGGKSWEEGGEARCDEGGVARMRCHGVPLAGDTDGRVVDSWSEGQGEGRSVECMGAGEAPRGGERGGACGVDGGARSDSEEAQARARGQSNLGPFSIDISGDATVERFEIGSNPDNDQSYAVENDIDFSDLVDANVSGAGCGKTEISEPDRVRFSSNHVINSSSNLFERITNGESLLSLGPSFLKTFLQLSKRTRGKKDTPFVPGWLGRDRDRFAELLPCPLGFVQRFGISHFGIVNGKQLRRGGGRQRKAAANRMRLGSWLCYSIAVLNSMYCSTLNNSKHEVGNFLTDSFHTRELSAAQASGVDRLLIDVERFFSSVGSTDSPPVVPKFNSINSIFERVALGEMYGQKSYKAEDIVADRISFPSVGEAAVVDVAELIPEEDWIRHPETLIIDREEQLKRGLDKRRVKRTWAAPGEFSKIVRRGVDIGLFRLVPKGSAARDAFGRPILAGCFAVPKPNEMQRFIINLDVNDFIDYTKIPSQFLKPNLPHASQLTLIVLESTEVLVSSEDDERCCFYSYKLPESWGPYLTLSTTFDGQEVQICGLPMGFSLSVGIIQVLERIFAQHALLAPAREVRPDRPLPDLHAINVNSSRPSRPFLPVWWIYVDNFNEFVIHDCSFESLPDSADRSFGEVGEYQAAMRLVKQAWNVPLEEDKAVLGGFDFDTLGARVSEGRVGVKVEKRMWIIRALALLLCSSAKSYGEVQTCLGLVAHCLLFRRPLFSILGETYRWIQSFRGGTFVPDNIGKELWALLPMLIFAETDLRAPVEPKVFCSDASPYGGAYGYALCDSREMKKMLRCCDIRGTKVRVHCLDSLDEQLVARAAERPHSESIPVEHLDFRLQLQYKFQYGLQTPIVLLEAQVFVLSMRITLRDQQQHGFRRLHVLDSSSSLGSFAKGRSSSRRLNRLVRKQSALCVFSGTYMYYGWISTHAMPMDEPSRNFPSKMLKW